MSDIELKPPFPLPQSHHFLEVGVYGYHMRCVLGGFLAMLCEKKQRHYFANKGPSSQGYGFSSDHVWI